MNLFPFAPPAGPQGRTSRLCHGTLLLALLLALAPAGQAAGQWDPIPPEDLAATPPPDQPDCSGEILRSTNGVQYLDRQSTVDCFRRIKVYTQKGVEEAQKLAVEYPPYATIARLTARLVRKDGSIVEFAEDDFHETTVMKFNDFEWKSRQLLVAALAPGDILEYRWRIHFQIRGMGYPFTCQEALPVREYRFTVDNINGPEMHLAWYNTPGAVYEELSASARLLRLHQVPPFRPEPEMPPEFNTRGMILLLPGPGENNQAEGWRKAVKQLNIASYKFVTPDSPVRALATELAAGATSDEQKLQRFYDYCQTKIINIDHDDSAAAATDREEHRKFRYEIRGPAEVLKLGRGDTREVNSLFAGLAKAAKFDVRLAAAPNRRQLLSPRINNGWDFIVPQLAAIRLGTDWRYFSPADRLVSFGRLAWWDEGGDAKISDQPFAEWTTIPSAAPGASQTLRTARLQLREDGTLEGNATLSLTGHLAQQWRSAGWRKPHAERLKRLRNEVTKRLPNAEVSAIRIDGLDTADGPLQIHFHLRVPDYAPPAGNTLVLVPNVFEAGASPRFAATERIHPIVVPFSYEIHDRIEIVLPPGFDPGTLESPPPVGQAGQALFENTRYSYDPGTRQLVCARDQSLGTGGLMLIAPAKYQRLRSLFDAVNKAATQAIVVTRPPRPESTPAADLPPAAPSVTTP